VGYLSGKPRVNVDHAGGVDIPVAARDGVLARCAARRNVV
jgi:hypothetical protein